jgi:hypothetical protein
MSVGGWGAAEYFEIFNKALYLQPRVVIIAFYTGNDALDTFAKVYGDERWKSLRLNTTISASDAPALQLPIPESSYWKVEFKDGTKTVFVPDYRHLSNSQHPAVQAGYNIMGNIAQKIGELALQAKIQLVFTIIPTKELVYKKKLIKEDIMLRSDYRALMDDEVKNIHNLAEALKQIPNSLYVDVLEPLQNAAIELQNIYPSDRDGHPVAGGYKVIGETLKIEVEKLLPDELMGGIIAKIAEDKYRLFLVKNEYFYLFSSKRVAEENGWTQENMKKVVLRDISKLPFGGTIKTVDPSQFGPKAFVK